MELSLVVAHQKEELRKLNKAVHRRNQRIESLTKRLLVLDHKPTKVRLIRNVLRDLEAGGNGPRLTLRVLIALGWSKRNGVWVDAEGNTYPQPPTLDDLSYDWLVAELRGVLIDMMANSPGGTG